MEVPVLGGGVLEVSLQPQEAWQREHHARMRASFQELCFCVPILRPPITTKTPHYILRIVLPKFHSMPVRYDQCTTMGEIQWQVHRLKKSYKFQNPPYNYIISAQNSSS